MQPSDRVLAKVLVRMTAIMAVFAAQGNTTKGAELTKLVEDLALENRSTSEIREALSSLRKETLGEMRAEQEGLASPVPYPTNAPQPRDPKSFDVV